MRSYLKNGERVREPYGSARAATGESSGARKEVEVALAAWLLAVGNQSPGEPAEKMEAAEGSTGPVTLIWRRDRELCPDTGYRFICYAWRLDRFFFLN